MGLLFVATKYPSCDFVPNVLYSVCSRSHKHGPERGRHWNFALDVNIDEAESTQSHRLASSRSSISARGAVQLKLKGDCRLQRTSHLLMCYF